MSKNTVETFKRAKQKNEKISMLTAYDYSMAKIIDQAGVNSILVGDSLANVILGHENTLSVTMEEMIHHGKAVARAVNNALLIIDLPFMSYQSSVYDAVVNAGRLVKEAGAHAVKLEGGIEVCPQIEAITKASIPVVAHLGLTPQSLHALGGYKVQGKDELSARNLVENAKAVERAGAFALVLECVPAPLASYITQQLEIPTIGIGAGAGCDGQVLVDQDMLGLFSNFTPKFVKQYANLGELTTRAIQCYIEEVQQGKFPQSEHEYAMQDDILEKLY